MKINLEPRPKVCVRCKKIFYIIPSKRKFCDECLKEIDYIRKHKCSICKRQVKERDQNGRGYECGCHKRWNDNHFRNINKKNSRPGKCKLCGRKANKRDGRGYCSECVSKIMYKNEESGFCKKCNKYNEERDQHGLGIECGCSIELSKSIVENKKKAGKCAKCGKWNERRDQHGYGYECKCQEKYEKERIENNKKPGICKRCGVYSEKRDQLGICENCSPHFNFIENNKCDMHPDQKFTYKGECWDCFKEKFKDFKNSNFINEISNLYPNAFIQPTFRTQESDNWTGVRNAFERSLVEKNLNYFVYIKFYIKDGRHLNKFYPLVVGKSGSCNVNNKSDVSFSIDINDGPARKFLLENNYNWLKTNILIIPTENESEALNIEKEIYNKYNLFYS